MGDNISAIRFGNQGDRSGIAFRYPSIFLFLFQGSRLFLFSAFGCLVRSRERDFFLSGSKLTTSKGSVFFLLPCVSEYFFLGNGLRKQSTARQHRSHEKHSKRKEIVLHRIVFTKVKILNEYTKSPIKNKRLMEIRFFLFSLVFLEEIGKVNATLIKTKGLKCLSLRKGTSGVRRGLYNSHSSTK